MNKKQLIDFALKIDARREQWRVVTGPRRQRFLYHVESCAAWSVAGERLPDAVAHQLAWSYAAISKYSMPL